MTTPEGGGAATLASDWRYRAALWSVLLAALAYLAFAVGGGWANVASAARNVGLQGIAIMLGLSLANYLGRFLRWQQYLRTLGHPVPWWPSLRIYLAGFALTTTPAKAGEALRSVLLTPWGVPYRSSIAALLSERLSDLIAILVLALLGLTAYPRMQPLIAIGAIGVMGGLLVISNHRVLQWVHTAVENSGRVLRILARPTTVLLQAGRCHAPSLLAVSTGLSLVAWAAEGWAFHLVLQWTGADVSLLAALSIYALSMLAGALSFMPGGLGGAEATMIALLSLAGVGTAESIAATLLIRLTTLWFAVGLGAVFLLRPPALVKQEGADGLR